MSSVNKLSLLEGAVFRKKNFINKLVETFLMYKLS